MWEDRLPDTYEMYVRDGGDPALFEDIIAVWVAAGGDPEESAKRYLMGSGRLRATLERFRWLTDKGKSGYEEVYQVGLQLRPLP
jgi:hypothetical protein